MENAFSPLFRRLWRTARPWLLPLVIIVVLRYTGLLAIISQYTGAALLYTGLLNASTDAPAVIHPFPYDFTLEDLQGNTFDVTTLRGKTIFINLWATWCGPCRIEMPSIDKLYQAVDTTRVAFLMISLDDRDDLHKVQDFVNSRGFSFAVYRPTGALPDLLRVRSIPTTFIIDKKGKIIVRESGLANYNTKAMKTLLENGAEQQ